MDDLAQLIHTFHPGVLARDYARVVELVGQDRVED